MDPINDVNPICPCWIIMKDGSRHRCDIPIGVSGNLFNLDYSFIDGTTENSVPMAHISAFENIGDPTKRIALDRRSI